MLAVRHWGTSVACVCTIPDSDTSTDEQLREQAAAATESGALGSEVARHNMATVLAARGVQLGWLQPKRRHERPSPEPQLHVSLALRVFWDLQSTGSADSHAKTVGTVNKLLRDLRGHVQQLQNGQSSTLHSWKSMLAGAPSLTSAVLVMSLNMLLLLRRQLQPFRYLQFHVATATCRN